MKLFLLHRGGVAWYDQYEGKLIRAETEKRAREIANEDIRGEGKIWDRDEVICEIITLSGKEGVVMADFNAG